jgi:hypothetical protein
VNSLGAVLWQEISAKTPQKTFDFAQLGFKYREQLSGMSVNRWQSGVKGLRHFSPSNDSWN